MSDHNQIINQCVVALETYRISRTFQPPLGFHSINFKDNLSQGLLIFGGWYIIDDDNWIHINISLNTDSREKQIYINNELMEK